MGSVGMLVLLLLSVWCIPWAVGGEDGGGRRRLLLGFREAMGNASFQCSPSGPCLPCLYSEKNDEKYRCSETGYRVPLKCVQVEDGLKEKVQKPKNKIQRRLSFLEEHEVNSVQEHLLTTVRNLKWRKILDDSSTSKDGKQSYITYRSCVPVDDEEKLSVLGFEVIMVCLLLISGPVIYMRQKRVVTMPGAVRIPTSSPSRF